MTAAEERSAQSLTGATEWRLIRDMGV